MIEPISMTPVIMDNHKNKNTSSVVSSLLNIVRQTENSMDDIVRWSISGYSRLLFALLKIYKLSSSKDIVAPEVDEFTDLVEFDVSEKEANKLVSKVEANLVSKDGRIKALKPVISYLLDELICNMQQHAQVITGFIYADFDIDSDCIDICLADKGVTIYGSYVQSGKYLDFIGNSAAEALNMAKDGYSTKNRPNAENRGYGISSNVKMITAGLNGNFAMLSGNALMINFREEVQVASLPEDIEWEGTCVIVRIPIVLPSGFCLYDYIS